MHSVHLKLLIALSSPILATLNANNYKVGRPSAVDIELIELGGTNPTSVTTAVMYEGGVRS